MKIVTFLKTIEGKEQIARHLAKTTPQSSGTIEGLRERIDQLEDIIRVLLEVADENTLISIAIDQGATVEL